MEVTADGEESYHDFVFIIMIIGDTPRNHDNFGAHDSPRLTGPGVRWQEQPCTDARVVGHAEGRSSEAGRSPRAEPLRRLR